MTGALAAAAAASQASENGNPTKTVNSRINRILNPSQDPISLKLRK